METTQPEILNADRTKVHLGDNSTERVVPAPAAARPDPPTPTLRRMVREDQICMLTFDRPGSAANIFDLQTLKELGDELEFIAGAPQIKGLILTSAKR